VKKRTRKNPHAVALGRLGGLVRSRAKKRANKQNGRKGGLVKSRKKTEDLSFQTLKLRFFRWLPRVDPGWTESRISKCRSQILSEFPSSMPLSTTV
jgi:hypothetical protein